MEIDKEEILNDINVINRYLSIIRGRKKIDEEFEYLGISMALFTILNKIIELGEDLVDSFDENYVPKRYMDIADFLFEKKVLTKEQFKIYRSFISYRNEIAHEYEEIKDVELDWCLKNLDFIDEFVKIVKNKLLLN